MCVHSRRLESRELSAVASKRPPRVVVLGAGIAGLSAAHRIASRAPHVELSVLEAAERAGGLVQSERTDDGFLLEHGPDGLLTVKPEAVSLARELGLEDELCSGIAGRSSYICDERRMLPLPQGLMGMAPSSALPMLRSPLLSWRGKLRLLGEPWVRPRGAGSDESVASFVSRRFGREMLDRLVAPLLEAIHRTPVERLSTRAALPALLEMERAHGSVARAMRRRRRAPALAGEPSLPPVVTLRSGMATLPQRLAHALGGRIRHRAQVTELGFDPQGGYRIACREAPALHADAVVIALPAYAASHIVKRISPALSAAMASVSYAPVRCVNLAWNRADVPHALNGTGFVVPAAQRRAITACTWSSAKWPGRAPRSAVLLRAFLREDIDDVTRMRDEACRELRDRMGILAPPRFARVHSIDRALPRKDIGCLDQAARMHEAARALESLALAGHAYGGSSLPDCIRSGMEAADGVIATTALPARS